MKIVNKLILSALSMFSVFNVVYTVTKEPTINYAASTEQRNYIQIDASLDGETEFLYLDDQLSFNDIWEGSTTKKATFVKDANSNNTGYFGLQKVKYEIARNTSQIAFEIPKLQGHYDTDNLKYIYYQFNCLNAFENDSEYLSKDFLWINGEPVASLVWTNDGLTIYGDDAGESDTLLRFAEDGMVYIDSQFDRIKNLEVVVPYSSVWRNSNGGLVFYTNTYNDAGHIDCYVESSEVVSADDSGMMTYGADVILNIKNKLYKNDNLYVKNIPFSVDVATSYNGGTTTYDLVEKENGSYYVKNMQVEDFDDLIGEEITYYIKKINYRQTHETSSGTIEKSYVKSIADDHVVNYTVKSVTAKTILNAEVLPVTEPQRNWYDTLLKQYVFVIRNGEWVPIYTTLDHTWKTIGTFVYFSISYPDGTDIENMQSLKFTYLSEAEDGTMTPLTFNLKVSSETDKNGNLIFDGLTTTTNPFLAGETVIDIDGWSLINLNNGDFKYEGSWWKTFDFISGDYTKWTTNSYGEINNHDYLLILPDKIPLITSDTQHYFPERQIGERAITYLTAEYLTESNSIRRTSWYKYGLHEVYNEETMEYDIYDKNGNLMDKSEYIYDVRTQLIVDAITNERIITENQYWSDLRPTHADNSDVCNIFSNIEACIDKSKETDLLKYIKIVGGVLLGIVGLIGAIKLIDVFNSISTKIKEKKKK